MVVKMQSVNFEEALNLTGFGKFNFLLLLVNISLMMSVVFEMMSISYLVPASACELNTTNFQQGLMAGMPLLGFISSSHFWGYLADTRGRRKVLLWCMFLAFVIGASSALSTDWIVFSVLKFFSSSTVAGSYALAVTLVSECTPQNKRSMMVSMVSSIYMSNVGLMAVLAIPVLDLKFVQYIPYINIYFNSWRLLCIVFAAPSLLGALAVYLTYESPKYLYSVGKEKEALEVLKGIYSINTRKSRDCYNVSSLVLDEVTRNRAGGFWSSVISQTKPLLKPPLLKNTLIISMLYIIVYFGVNPFLTWLPYIADAITKSFYKGDENLSFCDMLLSSYNETISQQEDCSLNKSAMVTVFVICNAIAVLNTIFGIIINYVGRKCMLIGLQLLSGIAGICVTLTNSWILGSAFLIVFLFAVLNFGFLATYSVDVFPTYVRAMAVCLTLMVGRGSSVFGINILKNWLVYDCEVAFYGFGAITFVGGLVGFMLPGDSKVVKKNLAGAIK